MTLGLNWLVGLISVVLASELVFDLTGSATFIAARSVGDARSMEIYGVAGT